MTKARDRADRTGSDPIRVGNTVLETDSNNDLVVKDTNNAQKKVIASEVHLGTGTDKVILKRSSSDGKLQLQTTDGSTTSNSEVSSDSGGSGVVVQEEGSALSTAATTLNFVGSSVTASGSGSTKTITISAGSGGTTTVYADIATMTASSPSAGDQALVTANSGLYIYNGNGWYKIATVNTSPTISSPSTLGSFSLASDGTATSIELVASDVDEGTTLQNSYAVTSGSITNVATVTSSSTSGGTYASLNPSTNTTNRFFKITPNTNGVAGSFTLTFSVSDSINAATTVQSFSLVFDVNGSVFFNNGNDLLYTNGVGHGIQSPASNDLVIGTNDFTIEFWHWSDNFNAAGCIFDMRDGHSTSLMMNTNGSGQFRLYANSSYRITTNAVTARTWNHVAIQRTSNVTKVFLNGTEQSTTYADTNNYTGNKVYLGTERDLSTGMWGYLSNFRMVIGSTVYSSNFTTPTSSLENITNTKLLALQASAPKYETGGAEYMTTRYSRVSMDDAALEVGTGDFTIEFYYKFRSFNSATSYYVLFHYQDIVLGIGQGTGSNPTSIGLRYSGSWAQHGTTGVGLDLHRWYHAAVVRTGGYIKAYIDGVEIASTTSGASANINDGKLAINGAHTTTGYGLNGGTSYSQFRHCSKAVYTGAFTPPRNINKTGGNYDDLTNVSHPTASQTELLTFLRGHYTGGPVDESDNSISLTVGGTVDGMQYGASSANLTDNSSLNHTLTQTGLPKGSYVTPFDQGKGSIESDDYTNRYIYVDDSDIQLGSGDFCIEYWFMDKGMYGLAQHYNETYEYNGHWAFSSSSYVPFPSSGGISAANGFTMYHQKGSTTSSGGAFYVSNITSGSNFYVTSGNAVINPLTWYHFALVRESNEIKLYFNGTRMPFGSTFTNSTNITYNRLAIGGGYAQYAVLTGHISNFRVVVGSPVYTGNFTVPTGPLTAITNTRLLTAQDSHQIVDASGNCTIIPVNGCAATRLTPF